MKERPILFSGEMVRAILAGRKTQTRRVVKPQWSPDVDEVSERPALDPILKCVVSGHSGEWEDGHGLDEVRRCPYGQPGDRLWVKETFCPTTDFGFAYRASTDSEGERCRRELGLKWKPSIFCTREASRITLEVTAVRVERLQDISEDDAVAEGVDIGHLPHEADQPLPSMLYQRLWEQINGAGSWAANPWVWVIEFKRIKP